MRQYAPTTIELIYARQEGRKELWGQCGGLIFLIIILQNMRNNKAIYLCISLILGIMGVSKVNHVSAQGPPLLVSVSVINATNCTGLCNGSASASPALGIPPYIYLWSDGQATQTATGLCPGTYSVIVKDAQLSTGQQTGTVTCSSVGVNEIFDEDSVSIFPNPSDGKVNLSASRSANLKICRVQVFNMFWETVYTISDFPMITREKFQIDLSNQPSGIYLIKLSSAEKKIQMKKIIISH